MSSILKALKRIEGQSPPPEAFPALPESVDAKQAVNTTVRIRWRLRRAITVSLILLIIAITAVIVFQHRKFLIAKIFPPGPPATHQQNSRTAGDKSKIFRAKIAPAAVKQAPKKSKPPQARATQKTVAPGQKTKKIRATNRSTQSRVNAGSQTTRPMPAVTSQKPHSGTSGQKPAPQKSSRGKYTPSKKSIAGKRTASSKPATAAVNKPKARTYAKLTDSKIKLQALAWSKDAARRMAVINGRIVREGESMDGYQINQIRQEDVVVSDGKQSWRLEFGLKQ